jgi:G3E family GTPase
MTGQDHGSGRSMGQAMGPGPDRRPRRAGTGAGVVAVVGTRPDARLEYATELAHLLDRPLVPAVRYRLADDPVAEALGLLGALEQGRGAVVEVPDRVSTADMADAVTGGGTAGGRTDGGPAGPLEAVVCVVDAAHGIDDLFREDYLVSRTGNPGTATARSLISATHVEYASTIVLVHWEDVGTDDLRTLLHHLNPGARLRLAEDGLPELPAGPDDDPTRDRPGWLNLLAQRYEPFVLDHRVSAVRYQCIRPFHPVRLHELAHTLMAPAPFGTVVRSAGYCRMASSPNLTGHWNHVGKAMVLTPVGLDADLDSLLDPWADTGPVVLGQDLAFIGLDLDRQALVAALDDAALTDAEFLDTPASWSRQGRRLR